MRRIVALVLLATFVVGGSHAAPPRPTSTSTPTPDEVMTIFGFSKKQRRALHAGEVVTMDLKRIGNEVVAVVALRMPLSLKEVEQTYIGPGAFKSGGNILAFGQPDLDGSSSWQDARFDAADKAELDEILNVEPGLDLNLSGPEIAALQERVGSLDSVDPTGAISEAYRTILQNRFRAYAEKGLAGVEPYDRGDGKQTQPGAELQSKWKLEVELAELFPTFYKAMASYPAEQPPEMQNLVFWVKERFESKWSTRSAFLLEHHAWLVADDHILLGLRQFFVGHTYNAQYGVSLVLPHEDGVVVFNWVDLTSDLAVRYVPFIALPIAQKIMRTQLKARYQDLLEDLPQ